MPILVRPVREQIEHDRVIRQLQDKWRRKYRADINPGDERTAVVQAGTAQFYPDLVLTTEGQKKPSAVVEVETGESVNHLEAMSQWATFAKSRIPFYLFVPAASLDTARRLVTDHQIELTELWTYFVIGEQIRFTPVIRAAGSAADSVVDRPTPEKRAGKRDKAAVAEVGSVEKADGLTDESPADKAAAEKPAEKPAEKAAAKATAEKTADKLADKQAAKQADKLADRPANRPVDRQLDKVAAAGKSAETPAPVAKRDAKPVERRTPERPPARPQRSERAAAPAPKARRAVATAGRGSAPPPRRKAAPAKRAATPKRGAARPAAKRAVAAKRPARAAAKAAVRRPAKTSRPAAKRARAQKRR